MNTQKQDEKTSVRKTVLDNGLRVLTSRMPYSRSATIGIFVRVGSRYEPADRAGVSHVVEHLVFKGTESRPSPERIAGAVEGVGGLINASTEQELTYYWCSVARQYLDECTDLLFDMLRNSLFEPKEIERERAVILQEQKMTNDNPVYRVDSLIAELLWPDHPLGRDVSGSGESVASMTRDMIVDHAARCYTPGNMVVSVAGAIDHDDVVDRVESLCCGWAPQPSLKWTPFSHEQVEPRVCPEYRKTEQSHFCIGVPGLSLTHPDRYVLDLLSVVLGEGMSSRLFLEIRERKGLAYDIMSGVTHFLDCGGFLIATGTDPGRAYDAVETILREVDRLKEGVPENELDRAKRLVKGRMLLRLEGTREVSAWMGSQESLMGRVLEVDEVVEQFNNVSPDDLRRVSGDLLTTEKLNMAVVGPRRGGARFRRLLRL